MHKISNIQIIFMSDPEVSVLLMTHYIRDKTGKNGFSAPVSCNF